MIERAWIALNRWVIRLGQPWAKRGFVMPERAAPLLLDPDSIVFCSATDEMPTSVFSEPVAGAGKILVTEEMLYAGADVLSLADEGEGSYDLVRKVLEAVSGDEISLPPLEPEPLTPLGLRRS